MALSKHPARSEVSLAWLLAVFLACLVLMLGLRLVFGNFEKELRDRGANERVRLFIGEEIVRGLQTAETMLHRLATLPSAAAYEREHQKFDATVSKLMHDLNVLKFGGTVRREMQINIGEQAETAREETFRSDVNGQTLVMEMIEIGPALGQVRDMADALEHLLTLRWQAIEKADHKQYFTIAEQIILLRKQISPFFERLHENANRLFVEGDQRLSTIEAELQSRRDKLRRIETLLIALVIALGVAASWLFTRRLRGALEAARAANNAVRLQKSALDAAANMIVITGSDGVIKYVNPAFCATTGYSAAEVVGNKTSILKSVLQDAAFYQDMWATVLSGRHWEGELINRRKDGSTYPEQMTITPIMENGVVSHFVAIKRDISGEVETRERLKLAEDVLRKAHDQALETSRLKSEFLATMSHEIRTPMNGIIGMTDLLLDSPLNPEQRDFAGIVRDSARALLTIINDILDFSKIEAGKLDIEITDFALTEVVDGSMGLLAAQAREKNLALTSTIDPQLPGRLRGDPIRLRQILLNLIGNAIKFTEHGAVEVIVQREMAGAIPQLRFEVRDSGIGLAADTQARLFQSFSQADGSITRKYGGTGLGLAISKQLVELMGGEIGVVSAEGEGATFWFTLPLSESAQAATASVPECAPLAPALLDSPANRRLILLAEDNLVNRSVAQLHLNKLGYDVHIVGNGQEAVAAAAAHPYAAILMDCQMPVMDGYAASAAIRQAESAGTERTPIIAMTASAMQGDRERCFAAGMDDYMSKPFKPEELGHILGKWVGLPGGGLSAVTETPPALQSISFERIRDIFGNDQQAVAEMLEVFRASTVILLDRLHDAIDRRDLAAVQSLGHEAKGACGTLGIERMALIAAALEDAALVADWPRIDGLRGELHDAFERVCAAIETQRKEVSG